MFEFQELYQLERELLKEGQSIPEQKIKTPNLNDLTGKSDLERAALKAVESIPEHQAKTPRVEIYKLRGRIGEELAQEKIGGVNLNDLTGKSNFANYDIVSREREIISSVKVVGLTEEGEPRYSNYNKYFMDIVNPDSKANQRAAKDMLLAIEENPELSKYLPSEIYQASTSEEMAHALGNKSVLQISDDQVDLVRDHLFNRIIEMPNNYGLHNNLSQAELEANARSLVDSRIQPISQGGYSSHELGLAAENIYVQKYLNENIPIASSGEEKGSQTDQLSPSSAGKEESEDQAYHYGYGY